jgi:hypothetical protein
MKEYREGDRERERGRIEEGIEGQTEGAIERII